MVCFLAPADSVVAGSAAEQLTEACVAITAGIAPEIARKARRERDAPEGNGCFISTEDYRYYTRMPSSSSKERDRSSRRGDEAEKTARDLGEKVRLVTSFLPRRLLCE